MMNNQVAFIICTNNTLYYEECIRYIEDLEIPEGCSIEIFGIQDAESMAQGYNAGMQASAAKYKVYLHQDTFILNRKFIYDIIEIFNMDHEIGMLGVIGTDRLPSDANCYLSWNIGNIEAYNGKSTIDGELFQIKTKAYIEVNAIDGLIIVTQYDVPWREDFLDGWDFYDVSQSLEMQRNGYKVVVPYQEHAWCYHDCGVSKLKEYDKYRKIMLQEYQDIFCGEVDENIAQKKEQEILQLENIRHSLVQLIERGEYEELSEVVEEIRDLWPLDTQIREIVNLMEVYSMEERSVNVGHSQMFQCNNWEVLYEYYKWVRLVLMRLEYAREDERIEELRTKLYEGEITKDAIRKISNISLKSNSRIYEYLLKEQKEEPLVSVVIPVYNGADIIEETLNSVLGQTYKNIEIIVIDDASTDNSREIISAYSDSRIKKVFLEKNRHICYSGNVGFQLARGKYVALIGHDDLWKEDKLEKQVSFLEEHPSYVVCFTWADMIDENRNNVNKKFYHLYKKFCADNYGQEAWIRKMIFSGNFFCAPSACIRREVLEKTGYYRYGLVQLQDYDLWLRILCEGPVYVLQEKLVLYRKFLKKGYNLSQENMATLNRDKHETQWIQDSIISKMPIKKFVHVFKRDMRNPQTNQEKDILCEKAFLLWNLQNCFAEKRFIELLEDKECRDILEENYSFYLTDFYKMNTEPMFFDTTLIQKVQEQERLIQYYEQQLRN